MIDEAAANKGWCSASTLIDLVKAFEHIPLEALWRKAKSHGFPLRLMCLVLELCAAPRRLVYKGAVSAATATLSAVVAGLVAAIDLMHLMVVDVLDALRRDFPCLRQVAYVDDLTLHRTGEEEEVREEIETATARLVKELEGECCLVVSRAKSAVVVSGGNIRRRVTKGMARLGIPVGLKARLLGVDYRPGRGRTGAEARSPRAEVDEGEGEEEKDQQVGRERRTARDGHRSRPSRQVRRICDWPLECLS